MMEINNEDLKDFMRSIGKYTECSKCDYYKTDCKAEVDNDNVANFCFNTFLKLYPQKPARIFPSDKEKLMDFVLENSMCFNNECENSSNPTLNCRDCKENRLIGFIKTPAALPAIPEGAVLVDKSKLKLLYDKIKGSDCQTILNNPCTECSAFAELNKEICERECFKRILSYCQVTSQPEQPQLTSWKFAMIKDFECERKIQAISKNKKYGNGSFYIFDGEKMLCVMLAEYKNSSYPEITSSYLLSIPDQQPEKPKLPEWIYGDIMARDDDEDSEWVRTTFSHIKKSIEITYFNCAGYPYSLVAPYYRAFLGTAKEAPEQIKSCDLGEYNLECEKE